MSEMAIVGLGSWGLCVLERTVHQARLTEERIRVHVVEPGQLGGGVYVKEQPDYLVLNNPCSQLSLYAAPSVGLDPPYAVGLYEWAVQRGYRWVDHQCLIDPEGDPILPTDYLPRRLMGEYLAWFYETLVLNAPPNLEIVRHFTSVVDIVATADGREQLLVEQGEPLVVDHVVLTSGHTFNVESTPDANGVHFLRPYPVEFLDTEVAPGARVAISGMGLVGFDLLTAFTVGRGGRYEPASKGRLRYLRSGLEPEIVLFSRTGVPYCAKSAHGLDPYGGYEPVVCTPERIGQLVVDPETGDRRLVDFRADLLPLILGEMQARYYVHSAFLEGGGDASLAARIRLARAWAEGTYPEAVAVLAQEYGAFDPSEYLFAGSGATYPSDASYQAAVVDMIEGDLTEAMMVGGSPVKAALEVMRILRDQLRSVIEFGGLTLESYLDFQRNVRSRINRIEAGPPPLRSQQLLALIDAGVVWFTAGPDPVVAPTADGRISLRSTHLDEPTETVVDAIVRGHLELPSLADSCAPLLMRLYDAGRLTQLHYDEVEVGSVAITRDFHPLDRSGRVQEHISVLGVLTEGVRYFTHYLPSPRSRLRAVLDAEACVAAVVGKPTTVDLTD